MTADTVNADLVHDFAALSANAHYAQLSAAAIDSAKKSVLDTLGVMLAASGMEPRVKPLVDYVRETGGHPECSVLGFGGRVAAAQAAFANGAMAHCLDFDDRTAWGAHCGSSAIPAVFALAERKGDVSGKQLITAIALAQDMFIRLRCNVGWRQDWNLSPMLGVFSATLAGAHVLGLTREQAAHALGIASMQSAGTMETIYAAGCDLRGMYAGWAAQGAVTAALLAQKGITGIGSLFEGKAGIFKVYFGGQYDRDKIRLDLGKVFMGAHMLYKPWPAVGISHTYIHAAIELTKQHAIKPADIAEIRVWVGAFQKEMCYPLQERRAPATPMSAKFSLPYCVAVAAAHRGMTIADFTAAALQDAEVLSLAAKVVPVEDERYDWKTESPTGRVAVVTRDGRILERLGDKVPGSPDAPITWAGIEEKFRGCALAAVAPLAPGTIDTVQDMARNLETLADATALLRVLT